MPTVEITTEQAAALAAGRSITVTPPPPPPLVAVALKSGHVYLIHDPIQSTYSRGEPCIRGTYTVLRSDAAETGRKQNTGLFANSDYTFVEVPR